MIIADIKLLKVTFFKISSKNFIIKFYYKINQKYCNCIDETSF